MEDIFELAISDKERDFVECGSKTGLNVFITIVEVFSNFPYVGSLLKLGALGNKYFEYRFIKKVSKFLKKDMDIPRDEKQKFLEKLTKADRKRISDYIMQYLLRAEDDEKAELMGFVYEECVYDRIDNKAFLRLCSIIDRAFLYDLRELPKYVEPNTEEDEAVNELVNLGLIDNFQGGVWVNEPSYLLNSVGVQLHDILHKNNWFD